MYILMRSAFTQPSRVPEAMPGVLAAAESRSQMEACSSPFPLTAHLPLAHSPVWCVLLLASFVETVSHLHL